MDQAKVAEAGRQVLGELLARAGVQAELHVAEDQEQVLIDVRGPETALVIGRKGMTLESLQLLVNKMVSKMVGDGTPRGLKPIRLDAEGYRARRAETLGEMARQLSEKALATGKTQPIEDLSAHDRRIVHMALGEVSGITTRSEGEGSDRVLLIIPTGAASSS